MPTPFSNMYTPTLWLLILLPLFPGEMSTTGIACRSVPAVQTPPGNFAQQVDEIIASTISERRKQHLAPLEKNDKLMRAAHAYAQLMSDRGQLSHRVSGQKLSERVAAVGYDWKYIGENVALNSSLTGASIVIDQWMRSEGHRTNILSDKFNEIGVGIAGPSRKNGSYYYCQIFGSQK